MDMMIDQQVALDEALVPHARRLKIGRSNFRLLSDISSKESTLQIVYDVLRQTPFFKAFLVTADVPEIYMQEFWATAMVHHHFIRHIGAIRRFTDVNINKLHQPWRSLTAIINKCLSGKRLGYDSIRLSQAQFLWGFYHKRNVDFAYLLWEDFVYQVKHKDTKKRNEMYYPRFTKVIIHHFMSNDPSIPRRNKFSAMLPIELTNADIKKSKAYKEYYAVATGATPPKTKASVQKTKNEGTCAIPGVLDVPTKESDEEISWKSSDEGDDGDDDEEGSDEQDDDHDQDDENKDDDDQDEGDDDDDDQEEGNDDDQDFDEEGEEFIHPRINVHDEKEIRDEESFDPIPKTSKNTDDEGNENEELLKTIDKNMQKIIKDQVKEQVKILIKKIEGNKSIYQSNEKRNLYKALVEAYESDKIILDTYRDTFTLKRRRDDDADKDEEPSVGLDWGSERQREGKEAELASAPKEKANRSAGKSIQVSKSRQTSTSESLIAEEPMESAGDAYSKRKIIAVTELKILEWHNYKHLYWITVCKDDDKLYKFKEGDFKRLHIQDIKDIDGTLTDVHTALDDHLKGIQMKYLPKIIWRKSDKERAAAMIQAINKQLKTRMIMRCLERFVGRRLYE
uniref:Uncharacterized protein n=1 Tax=Tanacetum cinerariifolium TaxID=118510 RepID=A0A6L2PBA3_TANCI|nr:hypothetical protein [Tanacetum cinerariifolium]